jgi:hypothetical protein
LTSRYIFTTIRRKISAFFRGGKWSRMPGKPKKKKRRKIMMVKIKNSVKMIKLWIHPAKK